MARHALVGAAIALAAAGLVSAQSQRAPATLDDLLTELRALRTDLNQVHSVGVRTQVVVGRVQVQEQRVATMRRELADIQFQLRMATQQRERTQSTVAGLEQAVQSGNIADERRRQQLEQELAPLQERLGREQQFENDLRSREIELATVVALEQGRWSDFNSRLDELERALAR